MTRLASTTDPRAPFFRRWFVGADVRNALRRWRHRPGFALTAVVTLALGIGATTAIFSIVDAVLLRPLPWTDPDRLVAIHAVYPERRQNPGATLTWNRGLLSYQTWDALREEPAFAGVATWRKTPSLDSTLGEARTALVQTMEVSARLLPMIGVGLLHGRFFTEDEDFDRSDSVLVSEEAWQRHFGGRADIVGGRITLGSVTYGGEETKVVVGVIERGFALDGDPPPDVLLPVGDLSTPRRRDHSGWLRVVAKLAPAATVAAANDAAARAIAQQQAREPLTARALPLLDDTVGGAARPLWLLLAAAGLLLLIACTNVAGLLLGEARARRHEIAVRVALGGSRARVVRQLLVEHTLLGVAGAVAGVMLGFWLTRLCVELAPAALPRLDTVAVDARGAVFALTLGFVTVLLFGVAPALSLARTPAARLAEGGRDAAAGRRVGHRIIVATAMALALVLLAGASLLGETLLRLTARPLGFDPSNLHVVSFTMTTLPEMPTLKNNSMTRDQLNAANWDVATKWTRSWWLNMSGAIERVAALPGVASVGSARSAPFLSGRTTGQIRPIGRPVADAVATRLHAVDEAYFRTMGTPILRGRGFESRDRIGPAAHGLARALVRQPELPTIISRELERRLFGDDGVGRKIVLDDTVLNVIGVVPDARWRKTDDDDLAAFYLIAEGYKSLDTLFVRTSGDAITLLPAVKRTIELYNPNIVIRSMTSMDQLMARAMAEERFRATLSLMFGGAALVLAAVGLYGLAARRVADRRREIAVRVALGARPADVRGLVTRDALRTIGIGLIIGLPAAIAASQVTQSFLYGVTPTAPHVFAIAVAVLVLAALVATILPARRAAAIDPMIVLKE